MSWVASATAASAASAPVIRRQRLRQLATAVAFTTFGLTALFLSVLVCPIVALSAANPEQRHRRVQRLVQGACRWFVGVMCTLGLVTFDFEGEALLRSGGQLIVANHPSLIDVLFLLACVPDAVCIVKQALLGNPALGWLIRWAGYVGNGSPETLVRDCVAALAAGHSLIIFPEGTRSTPGAPMSLRRGAARIALLAGADILPVRIECEPPFLIKGVPWHQMPASTPHLRFAVGEVIPVARGAQGQAARQARELTRLLGSILAQHLAPLPVAGTASGPAPVTAPITVPVTASNCPEHGRARSTGEG